jgi:hypothetical protein
METIEQESWISKNRYLVGILVVIAIAIAAMGYEAVTSKK